MDLEILNKWKKEKNELNALAIFGLDRDFTEAKLKTAYFGAIKAHHPDVCSEKDIKDIEAKREALRLRNDSTVNIIDAHDYLKSILKRR